MRFHKTIFGVQRIEIDINDIDLFLLKCMEEKIPLYHVTSHDHRYYRVQVLRKDVDKVKAMTENVSMRVNFLDTRGLFYIIQRFLLRKEWLIAIVFSVGFLVCIQHMVLDIRFGPMPVYIQKEIEKELEKLGLQRWAWIPSLSHPKEIERYMMDRLSSIQHILVERKGNNYEIYVEEKELAKEGKVQGPRHLVAKKSGVVELFDIVRGDIVVNRYEVVEKGDILVSGEIVNDQNEDVKQYVEAEGDVYARTWYEMNISMPLEQYKEYLVGVKAHQYRLFIGSHQIPIWGDLFHRYNEKEEEKLMENEWKMMRKWPIQIREYYYYEREEAKENMTVNEMKKRMTQYVTKYLKKNLGKHVKINKYYILQEKYDNEKVKWKLYVSVTENIAKPESIQFKR